MLLSDVPTRRRRRRLLTLAALGAAAVAWLVLASGPGPAGAAGPASRSSLEAGAAAAPGSRPEPDTGGRAAREPVADAEPMAAPPPPDARVAGIVTDEDGRPIASAQVWIVTGDNGVDFARDRSVAGDAEGRFSVAVHSGRVGHHAMARGYRDDERGHDVVPGEQDHEWLIVMLRGSTLRGTVLDADGKPLAGARVAPGHGARAASLAVVTAADGAFELSDLGPSADVRVDAMGHQPLLVDSVPTAGEPLVARLVRSETLTGTVRGPGAASASVDLHWAYPTRYPDWIYERIHPRAAAANGSFTFDGLPPGRFTVRAQVRDRARSRTVEVAVPQGGPVVLDLESSVEHVVTVLDETGRPIAGAQVALLERDELPETLAASEAYRVHERPLSAALTGGDGKASVRGPSWRNLVLAVRGDDCAPVVDAFVADCAPAERHRIVRTTRCGRVAGSIADTAILARVGVRVAFAREGDDPSRGLGFPCDAQGRFLSAPLPPGAYALSFWLEDRHFSPQGRQPGNEPLLRSFAGQEPPPPRIGACRIVAGATTRLETPLVVPPLGTLEGVVLASGRGVPGARVFAVEAGARLRRREREELLEPNAYFMHPNALTDAQGRFRFADPDGRAWELFARARESDATLGPILVAAAAPGATRTVMIRIPEGSVTGTFEPAGIPMREREWTEAYLFPIAIAEHDPVYSPYEGTPLTSGRRVQHVGMSGRFAFPFLAPGRYVLRVVRVFARLECQRVCDVAEGATVDLGRLEPQRGITVRVPCHVERAAGAWIRAPDPSNQRGVWVSTARVDAGALVLDHVGPGKYLVELFSPSGWFASRGISGSSLGPAVTIKLRADGTTSPAELR